MSPFLLLRSKSAIEIVPALFLYSPNVIASVYQGASVDFLFTIERSNFPGQATPSVTGLPSGVSESFTPSVVPINGDTFALRLTATGGATPVSNVPITVTIDGAGAQSASIAIFLTVVASATPAISGSTSKTSTSALQGASDSFTASVARTAYTGDVTVTVNGLPAGATYTATPSVLSGGVLDSAIVVTNGVSATPVAADSYTVDFAGVGVTAAQVAMVHSIVAPNLTRGVPNYTGAVKYDQMSYANNAALYAASTTSGAKTTMLTKQYGISAEAMLLGRTSVERGVTHNGHPVLSAVIKDDGPYVYFAHPPYITSYFSSPGVQSVGAYVALKFDPGWTTRGSGTTGQTFKIWALGYSGANGRMGVEWYNGNNWSFVGTPNGGGWAAAGGTQPTSYINNLTGQTVNMAPGAYGNGAPANRPSNAQIDALWAAGGTLCFYTKVLQLDARTHRVQFWVWVFGSEPPAGPAVDVTYTVGGRDLPGLDRLNLGETFEQSFANRYAPNPCYHHWCEWGVWNLATHPDPCGLE